MNKVGIMAVGAYIPYFYIDRDVIGKAWNKRGLKGVRSMINCDEDSVTMAVEAARQCFRFVDKRDTTGLFFTSASGPYGEKSHAGIVAAACDLPRRLYTADLMGSLKGGTSAVKAAADAACANPREQSVVVASECRNAYPNSRKEQLLGDASAAVVVGSENLIATIDEYVSVCDEIVDVWRNSGEQFVNWGESRFILDEGYTRSLSFAVNELLEKMEMQPSDFAKIILPAPDMREYLKLGKRLGFSAEQIQDPLLLEVGDCGTAQALLLLVAALEQAKPGDRLLVANYANGADAMMLTVTEEVGRIQRIPQIHRLLSRRREFKEYSRFLSFRKLCPVVESVYNLKPSNAQTWREQDTFLRFKGSRCMQCKTEIFPPAKVCGKCGAVNEFELVNLDDRIVRIFTFTLDELAGSDDDPVVGQVCANDESGVRYYNIMTDFEPGQVEVGMPLEFTFRKMNELGNFNNYYWKFRPVRLKEDGEQ
ncbi:MAG: hypothetical protein LIP16_11430 [Clostridium sp.]|nr:hypothetical protein [Clostridium sp.]